MAKIGTKNVLKYIGLGLTCMFLFPIAPLILGTYIVYKIFKSSLSKGKRWSLVGITIVLAIILTVKILNALPSPTTSSQPEVKSEKTEATPEPNAEPTNNNSSPTPEPDITLVKVINVVDGDTFKIETDEVVRLIGIDTPETVHPSKPIQCYGKEASEKMESLIEGKEIRLEKDVSETDRYGRLLRYVYVGDLFVNEYLVLEGFAKSSSYPPDIKYQNKFVEAQRKAQEENKGLWNISSCPTATTKPIATYIPKPTTTLSNTTSGGSYVCNCKKTCSNLSCDEAQYQLNVCNCTARDADHDGIACDSNCQ